MQGCDDAHCQNCPQPEAVRAATLLSLTAKQGLVQQDPKFAPNHTGSEMLNWQTSKPGTPSFKAETIHSVLLFSLGLSPCVCLSFLICKMDTMTPSLSFSSRGGKRKGVQQGSCGEEETLLCTGRQAWLG